MYHTSDTGPFSFNPSSDAYCMRSSYFIEGAFSQVNSQGDYVGTDHELMALNAGLHFDPVFKGKKTNWNPDHLIWGVSESRNNHERLLTQNKTYGDVRAKFASSNAHCKHKEGTMCEAYAATNWSATLEDLKWITDWQASQGITKFVPHAFFYSIEGYRKEFAPPNHYKQNHLWSNYRYFTNYIAKVCAMLSVGSHVGNIAVIEPVESLWKDKKYNPIIFFDLLDILNHSSWDYDVVSVLLVMNMTISNKCMNLLNEEYKLIILAGLTHISELTANKLKDFIHNGGSVFELECDLGIEGALKVKHESYDNNFITTEVPIYHEIKKNLEPDLIFYDKTNVINSVHFTHRTTLQYELYFVANLEGENLSDVTVSLKKSDFEPFIYNPTTCQAFKGKIIHRGDRTEIAIYLPFKSSLFIVVPKLSIDEISPFVFTESPEYPEIISLDNWQVLPMQENIMPISLWKDLKTNQICPAGQSNESTNFYFEFDAKPCHCKLLIPDFLENDSICINNNKLQVTARETVFDANYLTYDISAFIRKGKNLIVLSISKLSNQEKMEYCPIYLSGDFKVSITANQLDFTNYREWYHFKSCIANDTKVAIFKDNKKLHLGDWAKQGYPFYSGKVQYIAAFNLKQHHNVILSIDKLYGSATVEVNSHHVGTINWPPYELDITKCVKSGSNLLIITVENTNANILEEYPEKSGIANIRLFLKTSSRTI